jgi:hypothetical protein
MISSRQTVHVPASALVEMRHRRMPMIIGNIEEYAGECLKVPGKGFVVASEQPLGAKHEFEKRIEDDTWLTMHQMSFFFQHLHCVIEMRQI